MKFLSRDASTKLLEKDAKNKWHLEWLVKSDSRGQKYKEWLKKPDNSGMSYCDAYGETIRYVEWEKGTSYTCWGRQTQNQLEDNQIEPSKTYFLYLSNWKKVVL